MPDLFGPPRPLYYLSIHHCLTVPGNMPAFARDAPALEEVTGDRPQIGGNHPLDEAVIAGQYLAVMADHG